MNDENNVFRMQGNDNCTSLSRWKDFGDISSMLKSTVGESKEKFLEEQKIATLRKPCRPQNQS